MKNALYPIPTLVTQTGTTAKAKQEQGTLQTYRNAHLVWENGTILAVGEGPIPPMHRDAVVSEPNGRLVTAGLVDCHTHLVFGGWRDGEFRDKLHGVPYLTILERGGGILSTVKATKEASEDELYEKAEALLLEALSHGTTAMELKSGYGLDLETERKQLLVAKRLSERHPNLVSTFLGAHAFPPNGSREEFLTLLTEQMIPAVAQEGLAEFCDVFCDRGVFTAEEAERILISAAQAGLLLKLHADEIDRIGGTEVAARLGAISADHLSETDAEGRRHLKDGGVIAVMLPATSFYLNKPYGNFRAMIDEGIPVAVATDFNPGSTPNLSLPFAMTVACLYGRLTPEEALTAATLNGAAAIGLSDVLGTLEVGKQADFVEWDANTLYELLYRYGTNRAVKVYRKGELVCG